MARFIDAEELIECLMELETFEEQEGNHEQALGIGRAIHDVLCAPTVDAVPVIRCKDCEEMFIGARGDRLCWVMECTGVDEDDFCSWAERKKKGDL